MKKIQGRALAAALFAAALLAYPLEAPAAQAPASPVSSQAAVDWQARRMAVEVRLDMARSGLRLPSGRIEAQRLIDRELPGIVRAYVSELPVDSWRTVAECIQDGSIDVADLIGLEASLVERSATFTKDMRSFIASYDLPLEAVASLFVHHSTPTIPAEPLEYRASRAYTGIVIYVKAGLPVHGERVQDSLRPCLFPRLYDDTMTLLLDRNGVEPGALSAWGELGYVAELGLSSLARVGDDPLRIDATAVFGSDRGDIIIPRSEAMKILALKANRALLAAGRIVVVMGGLTQALGPDTTGAPGQAATTTDPSGESAERAEGPLYEGGH
jgi:hypothetical protein